MTSADEEHAAISPPKNTGGGGFVFENDVCAWLLACLLVGERPFDLSSGTPVRLDFQTRGDDWLLDDVLVTTAVGPRHHRFAFSIRSNAQFTTVSAPSDFVECVWKQWLGIGSKAFDSITDFLGIITAPLSGAARTAVVGLLEKVAAGDPDFFPSRLATPGWASDNERALFASFSCPALLVEGRNRGEAETARLLRRIRWQQHDFLEIGSRSQSTAVNVCRRAIRSGTFTDAETLWNELRAIANDLRPHAGTITREDLINRLRGRFALALGDYPDHAADWAKLDAQSSAAANLTLKWTPSFRPSAGRGKVEPARVWFRD